MNWEPMTEEAVFEEGEECLVVFPSYTGHIRKEKMFFSAGSFWMDNLDHDRYKITHFCRITNPNEVEP